MISSAFLEVYFKGSSDHQYTLKQLATTLITLIWTEALRKCTLHVFAIEQTLQYATRLGIEMFSCSNIG